MISTDEIRQDFPLLNLPGKPIIYFDNACMSLKPQPVLDAILGYYTTMSACGGRSNHRLAKAVSDEVTKARQKIAQFIGAKRPEEVVFTRNASESLNLLAQALELNPGEVVVISDKEHNSNLVPWLRLKEQRGIELRIVRSTQTNEAEMQAWQQAIDERVKVVSLVYTSNLDGVTNPVREIAALGHTVGATVIVDAAQAMPHTPMDVGQVGADYIAFSVHKMCGPTGMGVLWGKYERLERLQPFMAGGDTVAATTYDSYTMLPPPEKFEAGLQDYAGIIGAGATVDYLSRIGMKAIMAHEADLNTYASQQLKQFERIQLIGPLDPLKRGGVVAFTVDGADHHQVALLLDQVGNVMVRSGQHCVHAWFHDRGLSGSVRASFYLYNTRDEIDVFIDTLKKVMQVT